MDFRAEAPSRTIIGDTAGGTITAVQVFEVTGEGARDVIVGMSGNKNGVGAVLLYDLAAPYAQQRECHARNRSRDHDDFVRRSTQCQHDPNHVAHVVRSHVADSYYEWCDQRGGSGRRRHFGEFLGPASGYLYGDDHGDFDECSSADVAANRSHVHGERAWLPQPDGVPRHGPACRSVLYNILFRHSRDGYFALWKMNGVTLTGIQQLSLNQLADPSWRIAGNGDLDGDGERDIVWESDSGLLAAWMMNGARVVSTVWLSINQIDPNWQVRAVGDVNGDGRRT